MGFKFNPKAESRDAEYYNESSLNPAIVIDIESVELSEWVITEVGETHLVLVESSKSDRIRPARTMVLQSQNEEVNNHDTFKIGYILTGKGVFDVLDTSRENGVLQCIESQSSVDDNYFKFIIL